MRTTGSSRARILIQKSRRKHATPPNFRASVRRSSIRSRAVRWDCLDLTLHRLVLCFLARNNMANRFGPDILIQAPDPKKAALFYVNHLGFEITDNNPK